jgi:hypothetical protein
MRMSELGVKTLRLDAGRVQVCWLSVDKVLITLASLLLCHGALLGEHLSIVGAKNIAGASGLGHTKMPSGSQSRPLLSTDSDASSIEGLDRQNSAVTGRSPLKRPSVICYAPEWSELCPRTLPAIGYERLMKPAFSGSNTLVASTDGCVLVLCTTYSTETIETLIAAIDYLRTASVYTKPGVHQLFLPVARVTRRY